MPYDVFGPFDSDQLDYPCWEPRKRQSIDQMRRAEKCLDQYWEKFDHGFHSSCGNSIVDYHPPVFKCRKIIQTPEQEPNSKPKPKDSGIALDEIDITLARLSQAKSSKICNEAVETASPESNIHSGRCFASSPAISGYRPNAIHVHRTFVEGLSKGVQDAVSRNSG